MIIGNPRKDLDRSSGLSVFQNDIVKGVQYLLTAIAVAFATPLESWLRYDYGERYYSRSNYVSGLIAMYLWLMIVGGLTWMLSSIPFLGADQSGEGLTGLVTAATGLFVTDFSTLDLFWNLFYYIWLGHVVLGGYHFYRMWYRSRTGQALHSYDSGKSRLNFIARWLFKPINLIADMFVKLMSATIPPRLRKHERPITPVFKHEENFAKLYLEPTVGFLLFAYFLANGYGMLGMYFLFAGIGLGYLSKLQLLMDEGQYLDLRDQYIMQTAVSAVSGHASSDHAYAEKPRMSPRAEDAAYQISKIVENQPDLAGKVKKENGSLFDMMEKINPNLRKMTANGGSDRSNAAIIENNGQA